VALVGPIFFDTSVLLAGLIELGEAARPAQRIFDAVAERKIRRPHTAWHCCLEFYAVSTRLPEDLRLSPADAWRLLDEELLGRFEVHQLPAGAKKTFLENAASDRVVGGRIYDAYIGEIARRAGARVVVTDNRRHFTALLRHGIRVLDAGEFSLDLLA
jgi:predicted nucleic acid-binding protein